MTNEEQDNLKIVRIGIDMMSVTFKNGVVLAVKIDNETEMRILARRVAEITGIDNL